LAKASEQFRQSDVTLWGIAALACLGLAVLGSNASLLVPQAIVGQLHQPRVAGGSIEALRQQVSVLQEATLQLRNENEALLRRVDLQQESGSEVVRRVGALEVTVPRLLESLPDYPLVDRQNTTASIGDTGVTTFDAEGGSVSVRQSPMPGMAEQALVIPEQPIPEALPQIALGTASQQGQGVAIGAAVPEDGTEALWSDLTLKLGPLLFGLVPLVADDSDGEGKHIVVGPIAELAEASALCQQVERVAIACTPVPYAGEPLFPAQ
jgi:hypothetical protein